MGKGITSSCDSDKMGKSERQREQVSTGKGHTFMVGRSDE